MVAILGIGAYKCEACKHFDSEGDDGNHPRCFKQGRESVAIRINDDCPFGYEFGIPLCWPSRFEETADRAYEVMEMMKQLRGGGVDGD